MTDLRNALASALSYLLIGLLAIGAAANRNPPRW
jgi:hypothetical protein